MHMRTMSICNGEPPQAITVLHANQKIRILISWRGSWSRNFSLQRFTSCPSKERRKECNYHEAEYDQKSWHIYLGIKGTKLKAWIIFLFRPALKQLFFVVKGKKHLNAAKNFLIFHANFQGISWNKHKQYFYVYLRRKVTGFSWTS